MNQGIKKYYLILLAFLTIAYSLSAQDSLIVNGIVVDGKGEPIQNVSVSVSGSDMSPVLTGENGKFSLKASTGHEWLIITPVGNYKEKQVFLNNQEDLTIFLTETDMVSGYDQVQVINQKTMQRRNIVSSFSSINVERAIKKNIVSIDQAFQGNVEGMQTINHSGMPGSLAVNFIRGISSMNTSNSPLIVIDGMPIEKPGLFESNIEGNIFNPLSSLDPNDISHITILKDPNMTAVFGTRASNGVILIKTLEPKSTQTSINVSFRQGINLSIPRYLPQLKSLHYKSLANEILISSPQQEEKFENNYPGIYIDEDDDGYFRYQHNTNWQEEVFSNGLLSEAYFSMKGGSNIATYGLSIGYNNQEGIFKNTSFDRFNVRLVSDLDIFSWLQVKINASLSNKNSSLKESALSPQTNLITTSLLKPPLLGPYIYDNQGNKLSILDDVDELGTSNPVALANKFEGENKSYRFLSSILATVELTEALQLNSFFGLNFNAMKESVFMPNIGVEMYYRGEAHNVSQGLNNELSSIYSNTYLSYSKRFNSVHHLEATGGFRVEVNSLQIDFGEAKNLPVNDLYTSLQSGENDLRLVGGNSANWNWLNIYNQLSYILKDRYILNAGISADFSTLTGKEANTSFNIFDMPFGLFYSVGAGWRISNEDFLKDIYVLDNLMLRASYGTTGNGDIGHYSSLDYYLLAKYRETSGLIPGSLDNTSLKYEVVSQANLGLDLAAFGHRTRLSTNYFFKTTRDMFIYQPQIGYLGFEYQPSNMGNVRNTGLEVSFFQRIIDKSKFDWDIHSWITILSNKVTDMNGIELVTSFEGGRFVTRKGLPINSFYGYQFEGVFSTHEEAAEANLVNDKDIPFSAGDAIYRDVSGPEGKPDNVINRYDRVNLGSPLPDYYGGISNNFRYNRWSLNVLIQVVQGNKVFNYTRYLNERMVDLSNQSKNVLKRWHKEGDNTNVPRALWKDPVGNTDFSSRWIEDGSYIRLKNVTLGYSIPDEFLVFKRADFYVTATNLLTFNNYLGYNPEFSYSSNPMEQGIDYALMPQYRQFLLGVKIGL